MSSFRSIRVQIGIKSTGISNFISLKALCT